MCIHTNNIISYALHPIRYNTSWLELLRPSLELHDERPGIGKSIGCPHKVHGIHQLNTPTLGFGGKSLEGRLWHQSGGQTACWHKTSHWSADEGPIWYPVSVVGCNPIFLGLVVRLKISPNLLLFWWGDEGGRCYLMECKVVVILDTVAGRFLCPNGLPMLSMPGSDLGIIR
jgi:hypothetical protein